MSATRWWWRGLALMAVCSVADAAFSLATALPWSTVIVRLVAAVLWATFAVLQYREGARRWDELGDHMYHHGVVDGVRSALRYTACDHEWAPHRDEQTEDLGWQCTKCEAIAQ